MNQDLSSSASFEDVSSGPEKPRPEKSRSEKPQAEKLKPDKPRPEKYRPEKPRPEKGKVIILVAPSGAGKTTMARRLLEEFPRIKFSVSATTRPPRPGEIHGRDYFFMSHDEFQKAVTSGEFLEWEEFYGGKRYGSLTSEVEKELQNGYFVLFDIEVKGALNVKAHYGSEALAVFIRPPSDAVLIERLKNRGTESDESLQLRLDRARMELEYADRFDHVIVNDDLERCYRELRDLVISFMNETNIY